MLWWVCSVIKRRRQNVARASVALSAAPRGHIFHHVKSIAVKKHGDVECVCYSTINPLDTNISIYFLHTVLYTFLQH